jgi:hypothetical protein
LGEVDLMTTADLRQSSAAWIVDFLASSDEDRLKAVAEFHDELARLRLIAGVNHGLHRSAHEEADEWRERAETAERHKAEIRRFLDEDFRFWCSPYDVAAQYANDLVAFIDRLDDSQAATLPPETPAKEET